MNLLPFSYALLIAVLFVWIAWKTIFQRWSRLEDKGESPIGERLDFECRSCGELFEDDVLATHHVAQHHRDAFPQAEDGVVKRTQAS